MKWHARFRLLAVPLLTVLLLAHVPLVEATTLHGTSKVKDNDDKGKRKTSVPEGSTGALLVLAAGGLSGGLLLSRRKRRAVTAQNSAW